MTFPRVAAVSIFTQKINKNLKYLIQFLGGGGGEGGSLKTNRGLPKNGGLGQFADIRNSLTNRGEGAEGGGVVVTPMHTMIGHGKPISTMIRIYCGQKCKHLSKQT